MKGSFGSFSSIRLHPSRLGVRNFMVASQERLKKDLQLSKCLESSTFFWSGQNPDQEQGDGFNGPLLGYLPDRLSEDREPWKDF